MTQPAKIHIQDCLIYEQHPDHTGWCPRTEDDLDDYWEAWAWARARETDIRHMLSRARRGRTE